MIFNLLTCSIVGNYLMFIYIQEFSDYYKTEKNLVDSKTNAKGEIIDE